MGYKDLINTAEMPEKQSYELLPKGRYLFEIKNSSEKMTSSGGKMAVLEFMVVDGGEYDSRRIFENYNVENSNAKTVQIALSQLKQLSHAMGLMEGFDELYELHDRKFYGRVWVEKSKDPKYADKNRVGDFEPYTMPSMVVAGKKYADTQSKLSDEIKTSNQAAEQAFGDDDIFGG